MYNVYNNIMCMCMFVCACMYKCVCSCVCLYVHVCIMCMFMCMFVCACVYNVYVHVSMHYWLFPVLVLVLVSASKEIHLVPYN